ncbi:MAG: hypothetical protein V2A58_14055 [Planctomycetota bacterium]
MTFRRREILEQPHAFKYVYAPPGHAVGEHCVVRKGEEYHLFCAQPAVVVDETPVARKIAHATSRNLVEWEERRAALGAGEEGAWDAIALDSPFVIEREGAFHMFYTGTSAEGAQQIGIAISQDLETWKRLGTTPAITPGASWSSWRGQGYHPCRGACVVEEGGLYRIYYAAKAGREETGVIASASSRDLISWKDHGPVVAMAAGSTEYGQAFVSAPCVVKVGELYQLFVTYERGVFWAASDDPLFFEDFSYLGPYYASEVFFAEGRAFITSSLKTLGKADLTGPFRGLYLAGLRWEGTVPIVMDLADCLG